MGFFDALDIKDSQQAILFNTNTPYDILIGDYEYGINNQRILNSGISYVNAISGLPGFYKTNEFETFMSNALNIYPNSYAVVWDTENNKGANKHRYDMLAKRSDTYVSDRIKMINMASYDLDGWWKLVLDICAEKEKHKKDYMVETPFLDGNRKPIKIWIPTFLLVDSWSAAIAAIEMETVDETSNIADGSLNMVYMRDANIKNVIMRHMSSKAVKYGLHFMLTIHVGKKTNLTGRPERKDHQYMKGTEGLKNVGSGFNFLAPTLMQATNVKELTNDKGEAIYPLDGTNDLEINAITNKIIRSKRFGGSGAIFDLVSSQQDGVLSDISWYNYLKSDMFGLTESGRGNMRCKLFPDKNFTRKTLRSNLKDNYEFNRALHILGEYKFIQQNWKVSHLSADFTKSDDELCDKLINNKTPELNRILNSRGYWTYDKKEKREYMSTYDIILNLFGTRK